MDIYEFLDQHEIGYERYDHPAVFTVAEALELVPEMPGAETKNLFVKNKKGTRMFLVIVGYDKKVDLKSLAAVLGVKRLGFCSPDRLMQYLGVIPGAVSLLAMVNDTESAVEVVIDEAIWAAEQVKCHPLVNTATLLIDHVGLEKVIEVTNHQYRVVDVPVREG